MYGDQTGRDLAPLSEQALLGRSIWLAHNCQACHQIHGFGGFLGPDLTNASPRLDRARLDFILNEGAGAMPAFHMDAQSISAIEAYLKELDRTGVGQARAQTTASGVPFPQVLEALHGEEKIATSAYSGGQIFCRQCVACHTPLSANRIGAYVAPDLSLASKSLGPSSIKDVLEHGRPERGMPTPILSVEERKDLLAFIAWLNERRELVVNSMGQGSDSIPWFEYK